MSCGSSRIPSDAGQWLEESQISEYPVGFLIAVVVPVPHPARPLNYAETAGTESLAGGPPFSAI